MCREQKSFTPNPTRKQRIDLDADHEFLMEKFCLDDERTGIGFIKLDEYDLEILRKGDAVFLWETPFVPYEEVINVAQQAAREMAPEPGQTILTAVFNVIGDMNMEIDDTIKIVEQLDPLRPSDVDIVYGMGFCDKQKGVRFVLATSEGTRWPGATSKC